MQALDTQEKPQPIEPTGDAMGNLHRDLQELYGREVGQTGNCKDGARVFFNGHSAQLQCLPNLQLFDSQHNTTGGRKSASW